MSGEVQLNDVCQQLAIIGLLDHAHMHQHCLYTTSIGGECIYYYHKTGKMLSLVLGAILLTTVLFETSKSTMSVV